MSDTIGRVIDASFSQENQNRLGGGQTQSGGKSFENVLQQNDHGKGKQGVSLLDQSSQVSGAQLERLRTDLTQRLDQIPPGTPKVTALLPELLDTRTRLGLLKEAMSSTRSTPAGVDLKGRFGQVENEWFQVEQIMKSDKDLSTGQLLSLQARLYQVSQHIEVMSKVVDQVTGGVKTILNTNV